MEGKGASCQNQILPSNLHPYCKQNCTFLLLAESIIFLHITSFLSSIFFCKILQHFKINPGSASGINQRRWCDICCRQLIKYMQCPHFNNCKLGRVRQVHFNIYCKFHKKVFLYCKQYILYSFVRALSSEILSWFYSLLHER